MDPRTHRILFTVDVEEFDTALDFDYSLSFPEQVAVSTRGLQLLAERMEDVQARATLFTTAVYAQHESALIRSLAGRHEIASHGYFHLHNKPGDVLASRQALEQITGTEVVGFRRAQMGAVNNDELREAGFLYDSSLHPTYLPGRYNHWDKPRTPFERDGIIQIPASVTPRLRIPLFWLSLKNFPFAIYKQLCRQTLLADGHLNIYVHPWEFTDLSSYDRIPLYIRRHSNERLLDRVTDLLRYLRQYGDFSTMREFAETFQPHHH
ncbi:polysaccharide deacetylase family protein [Tellurirhabdus rosea]|uniref:polysaccharide deacetylase family protein n=1 Tax=Tellurirhabdus rosea TaxID=2674997 RepID=UPI00224EF296|nr:polysaccharide deacetylase family protein [Tellurirhabdus rosea]